MSMKKIQDILLETTASYQPLSDLNVRFWSQDKNTAELRFIITRNKFPLSLSKENVKVIIALESGSSFISSDDFIIDSEVEGVARYIIPTDFMRVANNVKGQVYVTTLDGEEVIVERQFKFTVSDDLLSDYPSEDKLRYIKTFDDLRTEISSRVSKLESDMESMGDYVTQVQDTTQEGITALTNLIKQKQDAYNANHTAKMKELDEKGLMYSQQLDDDKQYMDEKFEAFKSSVTGSGLVTTGESKDWQKYKLTSDGGYRTYLRKGSFNNVLDIATGYYETVVNGSPSVQGFPTSVSDNAFVEVDVMKTDNARMQVKVVQSSNGRTFIKNIHTDGADEVGWQEVAFIDVNNPFETATGSQAKANTAENNAKAYAKDLVDKKTVTLFEGTANGVGTTINLSETLDNFIILHFYGTFPGGLFNDLGDPYGTARINLTPINILDTDGNGGGIYEIGISKTTRTQLTISNDVFFDLGDLTGSGPNANKCTITRIVGVRK